MGCCIACVACQGLCKSGQHKKARQEGCPQCEQGFAARVATIRPKHQYSELAVVEVVLNDHAKPLKLPMHTGTALCLLQALRSKDTPYNASRERSDSHSSLTGHFHAQGPAMVIPF